MGLIDDMWGEWDDALQSVWWEMRQRFQPGLRDERYVPAALRRKVMQRDRLRCHHCGQPGTASVGPDGRGWHIDHVTPLSRGGRTVLSNLVLSCATCNQRKAGKAAF